MEPQISGENRNKRGQFKKGVSGNPAGKPVGTVSIVAKIKQKFHENPEYFEEWVDKLLEDAGNRRAVMEQIDGKPHQTTDITSAGKALPTPILGIQNENTN